MCRSESKRRIPRYFSAQPVLADRFGDDVDGTAENIAQSIPQGVEPPEIGEAAFAKSRADPDDEIEVRTRRGLIPRDRAEDRDALDTGGSQIGLASTQQGKGLVAFHSGKAG